MNTERAHFGMIYMNQKIYAVGGFGGHRSEESMEIFDLITRRWTEQPIPFNVFHHCMTQLSANQFILIAGHTFIGSNEVSKNVTTEKYFNLTIYFFLHFTAQNIFYKLSFLF